MESIKNTWGNTTEVANDAGDDGKLNGSGDKVNRG
jgi:hypothetical protein